MAETRIATTSQILGYLSLAAQLIEAGQMTVEKLKQWLRSEGVSQEQLDAMDARLTTAIEAREAEKPVDPIEA